jgi:hypothetical protein
VNCCCSWGCAIKGEWPEFECYDCERHKNAFEMADRYCKKHKRLRKDARVD